MVEPKERRSVKSRDAVNKSSSVPERMPRLDKHSNKRPEPPPLKKRREAPEWEPAFVLTLLLVTAVVVLIVVGTPTEAAIAIGSVILPLLLWWERWRKRR